MRQHRKRTLKPCMEDMSKTHLWNVEGIGLGVCVGGYLVNSKANLHSKLTIARQMASNGGGQYRRRRRKRQPGGWLETNMNPIKELWLIPSLAVAPFGK